MCPQDLGPRELAVQLVAQTLTSSSNGCRSYSHLLKNKWEHTKEQLIQSQINPSGAFNSATPCPMSGACGGVT